MIDGRGFGHGVGMAQDGALAMGRGGSSTEDILQHFYPGTSMGQAGGDVRVVVQSGAGEAVVSFPGGGEVRNAGGGAGFPVRVAPGGSVRLSFDGGYRVEPLGGATVAAQALLPATPLRTPAAQGEGGGLLGGGLLGPDEPPPGTGEPAENGAPSGEVPPGQVPPGDAQPGAPLELEPAPAPEGAEPGAPVDGVAVSASPLVASPASGSTVGLAARGARYRGLLHVTAGDGGLRLVNQLDVEDYLRGMGEVRDSSWPQAALGAQAVAARTYALRAMAGGGEMCDTQDCQVYLGQQAEYGAMDAAVTATRGRVVRAGGALAQTVYSASGGGVSATPEEGFGTSGAGLGYLAAVPYPTGDPQPWVVSMPLRELGRRLGYRGTVEQAAVAVAGPSGRALTVALLGDAGAREIGGLELRNRLGLRSTLWTLRVELPPPPPPSPESEEMGAGENRLDTVAAGKASTRGRSLLGDPTTVVATGSGLQEPLRAVSGLVASLLIAGLYGVFTFRLTGRGGLQTSPPGRR